MARVNDFVLSKNRKSSMVVGYKLSLLLVMIAIAGVQSAMEETSPIEQYTDSGATVLRPQLAQALKLALVPPTKGASSSSVSSSSDLSPNSQLIPLEYEDNDLDDFIAEIKRTQSWNQLHGGWGKRASPLDISTDASGSNWNRMNNLWGKRATNWNNLNSVWGKRAWNQLQNGWGKKRNSPHWNNLRNMWGRK